MQNRRPCAPIPQKLHALCEAAARMGFVIYLDHYATTPVLPEELEAMMPLKKVDSQQLRRFRFLL